jgi:HAD superfamily hydrolase (TIGR01549 family)
LLDIPPLADATAYADMVARQALAARAVARRAGAHRGSACLSAAGWRICFLSNGIGDTASRPRPEYFSYADLVAHSWEIGYCKPEAGAFRAAEQRMGLAPHQLVSIGDSLRTDVLGALAAGWSAVHLPRTSAPPPSPRIVPTISSLSELLSQMPTRPAGMEIQGS